MVKTSNVLQMARARLKKTERAEAPQSLKSKLKTKKGKKR